jgi:hypothetical protein
LHSQNPPVIFRDLKPSNVMLDQADTIRLIDFGIARLFQVGKGTDTLRMRTPGYAPLEQYAKHGQTDARSDIYALGATLYHLLTKHEPEDALSRALPGQPDPLQPARAWNSAVSPATEATLARAMVIDPGQRFQAAQEVSKALLGGPPTSALASPPAAPTVSAPAPSYTPGRRGTQIVVTGCAAIGVVVILALCGLLIRGFANRGTAASLSTTATAQAVEAIASAEARAVARAAQATTAAQANATAVARVAQATTAAQANATATMQAQAIATAQAVLTTALSQKAAIVYGPASGKLEH